MKSLVVMGIAMVGIAMGSVQASTVDVIKQTDVTAYLGKASAQFLDNRESAMKERVTQNAETAAMKECQAQHSVCWKANADWGTTFISKDISYDERQGLGASGGYRKIETITLEGSATVVILGVR